MLSLAQFKDKMARSGASQWGPQPALEFFWCFEMKASRDEIWSYLSDTSRFNRELGLAPRQEREEGGKLVVTTTTIGFPQEWIEEPWTWITGYAICSRRTYRRGMGRDVHAVFHIDTDARPDHRLVYIYFGWNPSNALWSLFLRSTGNMLRGLFARTFSKIDTHVAERRLRQDNALRFVPKALTPAGERKLTEVRTELDRRDLAPAAVRRLTEHVVTADDMDLEPIRLVPLAKQWDIPLRDLVPVALHATRLGLLQVSWEVICPHCRSSRASAGSLFEIPATADCAVCEISFDSAGPDSVEVHFHVHPSVRKVEKLMFCAAEPAKKSHIKVQQLIAPGQILEVGTCFPEGQYRARLKGARWERTIELNHVCSKNVAEVTGAGDPVKIVPGTKIRVRNDQGTSALFVLEDLWWQNQALKPAQVLTLPEFRDLFATEHLNSDVKLYLGEQALLFTDIVGSTAFYKEVGDGKAFGEVRSHFREVFEDVKAESGTVVKTIGDAVMASFATADEALRAAVRIQRRFHAGRTDTAIRLRISVHAGPVIAVQLNTGLDYFGNTVNMAAKIQACAGAGEIALSEVVHRLYARAPGIYPVDKRKNGRDTTTPIDVWVVNVSGLAKAA